MDPDETRRLIRDAFDRRDHAAILSHYAPDVVLHSPIITTAFEGHRAVSDLLEVVLEKFEGMHHTAESGNREVQMLAFHARVRGHEIDVVDLMRMNADGQVADITIHIRPMAGLAAVAAALGPPLARKKSRLGAVLVTILSAPLPPLLSLVEPVVRRLVTLRS